MLLLGFVLLSEVCDGSLGGFLSSDLTGTSAVEWGAAGVLLGVTLAFGPTDFLEVLAEASVFLHFTDGATV